MNSARSVLRHTLDVIKNERITTFVRAVSVLNAVALAFLAHGPLFRSGSRAYENPVFDGVFYFASPVAWGAAFGVSALVLLLAATSGRLAIYVVGATLGTVTLGGWAAMIMAQAATSDEAVLTTGAIGLYVGCFTSIIGLAFSPHQLEVEKPIVAVTDKDEVIPLRSAS